MLFQAKKSSIYIDGMHLMLDMLPQPNNNNNKCSACSVSVECIQAHFLMWCQQKVSVPLYHNSFHSCTVHFLYYTVSLFIQPMHN